MFLSILHGKKHSAMHETMLMRRYAIFNIHLMRLALRKEWAVRFLLEQGVKQSMGLYNVL